MLKKLLFSALAIGCAPQLDGAKACPSEARGEVSAAGAFEDGAASRTLFEAQSSSNGTVSVREERGIRRLFFEPSTAIQSAIRPGAPLDLQLAYTRAAMVALAVRPEPRRALVVGLGGGAMPMFLRALYPSLAIDVVDIDPVVVEVARRYLGFREDARLRAHVADGRRFVENAERDYDLVFLDAYGPSDIPRHLATVEFLGAVRARLSEGGLVVGNIWSSTYNSLYLAMRQSYLEAFGAVCALDAERTGNQIFLARREGSPIDLAAAAERAADLVKAQKLPFDLAALARVGCLADPEASAPALRD